ncbi:hypothetical protein [Sphingopyxis fribergensis]
MRAFGTLLIVCIALAVVKAAIAALLLALVIALIWAACVHPRETFGLLTYFAVMGVISAHPQLVLAVIVLAILGIHIGKKCAELP